MTTYTPGEQYLVNKETGAVFANLPRLQRLGHLELHEADDEGNLVKVGSRPPPELNPTQTPEKAGNTKANKPAAQAGKAPTMNPVSK